MKHDIQWCLNIFPKKAPATLIAEPVLVDLIKSYLQDSVDFHVEIESEASLVFVEDLDETPGK